MDRLRDVEMVLGEHPDIKDAAVVDDGSGRVAVVVPRAFASAVEIREYANARLGASAPQSVVLLAELPLGPGGELAMAEVTRMMAEDPYCASRYEPPRTPTEQALAGLVAEVLGRDRVGVTDDFIELGGDSVAAVQVVALIAERLGATVGVEDYFESCRVRELGTLIDQRRGPAPA